MEKVIKFLRYDVLSTRFLGELLSKNWIDNFIPTLFLLITLLVFIPTGVSLFTAGGLVDLMRQVGEIGFVTLGMSIVMLGGGIDLSVGSIFAVSNFVAITTIQYLDWPLYFAIPATLLVGAAFGAVNGVLVGFFGVRAFLATLATLIIGRAISDILVLNYSTTVGLAFGGSDLWESLGEDAFLGVPLSMTGLIVALVLFHLILTRTRFGWNIYATGGSRRSAYNIGIPIKRLIFTTYVMSGALTALGAVFYAARLASVGPETGIGLEITVLTGAILGGVSLGGGKGSVYKIFIGTLIVLIITNALINLGVGSGVTPLVFGILLLVAVAIDVRWLKNLRKIKNHLYVAPVALSLPPAPDCRPGAGAPWEVNDRLKGVGAIGLGELDGPEDMIFDSQDNLYTGQRQGHIVRFFAPDYTRSETFVHIGGQPLGLAMDAEDNIHVCVGGMGLYKVTPEREVILLTDETNRSPTSILDDSRLRMPDDLDIAPDGRIFFSDATVRFSNTEWPVDSIEARTNGRLILYDPHTKKTRTVLRNLRFSNGVCVTLDGESLLVAETWGCRVTRYWFDGPNKGRTEVVLDNLPGYPDNINRASDGNYWCAIVGMRGRAFDHMLRFPGVRARMTRRLGNDEWLFPNLNDGCVIKFDLQGTVMESLWDPTGISHPYITSMREHKGKLYLGGISNNRIGVHELSGVDMGWTSQFSYWGKK